ncbi:MAG: T9SS type A sorting domain-containing protein [Bacteroidia bacterium]
MNQLNTRLLLLLVVLVGFAMPNLFAQTDGLDDTNTDDEPCFAIWDTDDKRGRSFNALSKRYIDIFIPNGIPHNKYRAVVRFFDQSNTVIALPSQTYNNALVQDIDPVSLSSNISTQSLANGKIYTYELITPFSQALVNFISLDLYGYHLNAWTSLQSGGSTLWDVRDPRLRAICWPYYTAASKDKRLGFEPQKSAWIYPNPTSDILQITPLEAPSTLQIYDIRGSLLQSWQLPAGNSSHKISTQAFPAGIYYLKRQIGTEYKYQRIQVL